jgi:hypothetical protein
MSVRVRPCLQVTHLKALTWPIHLASKSKDGDWLRPGSHQNFSIPLLGLSSMLGPETWLIRKLHAPNPTAIEYRMGHSGLPSQIHT